MRISFIIPSRNNLKYLKQAVNSIQDNYGTEHDLVLLDDASTDGTWEWIQSKLSDNITGYRNEGPERVGHTVLYDKGVELSKTEIFTIFHADMVTTPSHVPNSLKHLKKGKVVSATRIEPPLHPPGPEKLVRNFGLEPEEFQKNKAEFLAFVKQNESLDGDMTTQGIFAPWMMYKDDFVAIGGHDKLFAPMELEDSDLFNRFYMVGYDLIQSRDSYVYHMTCRGSRYKDGLEIEKEIPLPDGTIWYKPKDSEEYIKLRQNKFKEWWRKWHCDVLHDELMMPIVPKRYDTTFVITNCNEKLIEILEPWCDRMYVDCEYSNYANRESLESLLDLSDKLHRIDEKHLGDVIVAFDAKKLNNNNFSQFVKNLPFIIQESDSLGTFEYDCFSVEVRSLSPKDMRLPIIKNVF